MVKVIVIDDDVDLVDTLSKLLEEKNVKVIGKGYDGEEAVRLYFDLKPDVLLLDIKMPIHDGHYAIEKIKEKDPNAKIIALTAYMDSNFQKNKVSAVISKPYEINDLVAVIKKIAEA